MLQSKTTDIFKVNYPRFMFSEKLLTNASKFETLLYNDNILSG